MKKIAVFDLDHTLIEGNASFAFGKYLYHLNQFTLKNCLIASCLYFSHKLGWLTLGELHRKLFERLFAGKSQIYFSREAESFVEQWTAYFPKTVDELKRLQLEGYQTFLLSSSPDFVVKPFAELLGFTKWAATVYQSNESGVFSALGPIMGGGEKAKFLNDHLEMDNNPSAITTAYTDSILDLPLLNAVMEPVAVNPDPSLRTHAIASDWRIL